MATKKNRAEDKASYENGTPTGVVKRYVIDYTSEKERTVFARDDNEAIRLLVTNIEREKNVEIVNIEAFDNE